MRVGQAHFRNTTMAAPSTAWSCAPYQDDQNPAECAHGNALNMGNYILPSGDSEIELEMGCGGTFPIGFHATCPPVFLVARNLFGYLAVGLTLVAT
jgi:hypothetical protein